MAYKRKDYYYKRAKEEGKASRAAFKIGQIQKKFKIVERGSTVVDLGAAPGGWMQELGKMVGKKGFILGIDKLPIRFHPEDNMTFYLGDLQGDDAINQLKFRLVTETADTVVCDMAPNTSGVGYADAYKSYELAQRAYEICQGVLKEGGNFVVKVFPGKENSELRADLKKSFRYVTTVVPPATRKTSSEQYFVARGFRGIESD